jgi:hypothetical protein
MPGRPRGGRVHGAGRPRPRPVDWTSVCSSHRTPVPEIGTAGKSGSPRSGQHRHWPLTLHSDGPGASLRWPHAANPASCDDEAVLSLLNRRFARRVGHRMRRRAQSRRDPAWILGAPLLGEVPRLRAPQRVADSAASSPPLPVPATAGASRFVAASLEHRLRVSLSHLGEVCERLPFVQTSLLGYVYLRLCDLGVHPRYGRIAPGPGSGPGIGRVATRPDQRA